MCQSDDWSKRSGGDCLGLGKRVRVGLSAGIFDEQIGSGLAQPETFGLVSTFSGNATGVIGN